MINASYKAIVLGRVEEKGPGLQKVHQVRCQLDGLGRGLGRGGQTVEPSLEEIGPRPFDARRQAAPGAGLLANDGVATHEINCLGQYLFGPGHNWPFDAGRVGDETARL